MPRYSLLTLFAVVTLAAVNFAGLKYAPNLWAVSVFAVTVGMLGLGLVGVVFRRREKRAFWVGFTVFGGAYLLLTLGPWLGSKVGGPIPIGDSVERIVGSAWYFEMAVHAVDVPSAVGRDGAGDDSETLLYSVKNYLAIKANLNRGGHSLFAFLAGLVGGVVGRWVRGRRRSA